MTNTPTDRRAMSLAATFLAALVMALTVFVVLVVLSLAWGMWRNDPFGYLRPGVALALTGMALTGLLVVGASYVVQSVLARPPVAPPQAVQSVHVVPIGGAPGDTIRIVPLASGDRLIDNVTEDDLRFFVENLKTRGHTSRAWVGTRMPSGRICDKQYWASLCRPLKKIKALKDVGPRKKGFLVTRSAQHLLALLQLSDPYNLDDIDD